MKLAVEIPVVTYGGFYGYFRAGRPALPDDLGLMGHPLFALSWSDVDARTETIAMAKEFDEELGPE